jgi:mono/diheme cytochrome c family protein
MRSVFTCACEERTDAAISHRCVKGEIASLALSMTVKVLLRGALLATKQSGFAALAITCACLSGLFAGNTLAEAPRLGKPVSAEEAAKWDLNVFPGGEGLPEGKGTAAEGKTVYEQKCANCHGEGGRGATAEELAGGTHALDSETPDKTIGLYWPHATTLFDFIRRSKPMDSPSSLNSDEVYAVTAYLLFANGVIGEREEMNAKTLPKVKMPNREGFIWIDAKPGIGK